MKKVNKSLLLVALLIVVGLSATTASADPINYSLNVSGVSISVSITTSGSGPTATGTAVLTIDGSGCNQPTATACKYMGDVSIHFASHYTSLGSFVGPAGYVPQVGGSNDSGCTANPGNDACFNTISGLLNTAGPYTFTITLNGFQPLSPTDTPSVKALFYTNDVTDSKVLQISQHIPGNENQVPEPASLALLGSGMLAGGNFVRRKLGMNR